MTERELSYQDKKEKARDAIGGFSDYLLNWSDEIPKEIVHNVKFKVRGHWFAGIKQFTNYLSRLSIIEERFFQEAKEIVDKWGERRREEGAGSNHRTNANEILRGNCFLEKVIWELREDYEIYDEVVE